MSTSITSTTAAAAAAAAAHEQQQQTAAAAAATTTTTTTNSFLPAEVVTAVLKHVDQQHRLTVCATVCRSWAAAAVAATTSTSLNQHKSTRDRISSAARGFSTWIHKYPTIINSVEVRGHYISRPQLLLPTEALLHLQQLCLIDCKVTATGCNSSSSSALGAALPSMQLPLTHLHLQCCVVDWQQLLVHHRQQHHNLPAAPLPPPSSLLLSNLQQLHLQELLPAELSTQQQEAMQQLVPAAFQQMKQLTQLVLKQLWQYETPLLAGLAAGLGCMPHLLHLQVEMLQLTAAALAELPSSLTLLELAGAKQLMLCSSDVPRLTSLSHLQQLHIEGVRRFEPRTLSCMPRLRKLRLRSSSSRFLPDGLQGTQDLLAALQQGLPDLESLDLRNVLQHLLPEQQLQAYCGLTAAMHLTQLDLSACRFPPSCTELLFQAAPGGSGLPRLQQLVLYRCEDPGASALQLHDLFGLVECCPALQDLSLWLSSSMGSSAGCVNSSTQTASGGAAGSCSRVAAQQQQQQQQLHALTALPGLTRLVLAGPGVTDEATTVISASLQQLSALALFRCRNLSDASIWRMTQLTRLTSLVIDVPCRSGGMQPGEYMLLQGRLCHVAQQHSEQHSECLQQKPNEPVWLQLHKLHLEATATEEEDSVAGLSC